MKNKRIVITIVFLTLLFFTRAADCIEADRTVLPNGLVLLHSKQSYLPVVHVVLLIKASPFDESPEKAGLANLTSSLLMEGTKNRTSDQLSEEVEFIGADLGASTSRDYTIVSLSVLKKHLQKGFELFSDILLNPVFSDEEIARKKELIKGNLKQAEDDPSFVASRAFRKAVYGEEHPYGRLVSGSEETIDRITRDDIVDFYKRYYRPNNAIMAVVGDISKEETIRLLKGFLKGWQKGKLAAERRYQLQRQTEKRLIKINRELTQANILLGHLCVKRSDPDYYKLQVMNYILGGGGFASRLMTRIRDEMGLAYDVHSFITSNKDVGFFQVGVQTKNRSARQVIDIILQEMRRIQTNLVTQQELEDAKAYLTGSFPRRIDTMAKIANFLVLTEFYELGMDYDRKYPGYINAVTVKDIQEVARKYLHPEAYTLVVVGKINRTGL